MRLINAGTLELHDFYLSEIPQYAILSHTWGDGEVSFHDMSLPNRTSMKGYSKIVQSCRMALERDLGFVWVDTCCIDKSSSAELTESINSMFKWYMKATVCYVFLEDLQPNTRIEDELVRCRWFTRGWTLQELLAPKTVEFYDLAWNYRGTKLDFVQAISISTGISIRVLREREWIAASSVATRMSWAARRQTTRIEDIGYCLLGIFDINMPLIYGEGIKAFRRLQEEIVKRNNDLTIFAWDVLQNNQQKFSGLFAPSPAAFSNSGSIVPYVDDFFDFSVTNKGLLISGDTILRVAAIRAEDGGQHVRYYISLGTSGKRVGGIYLRKIGPGLFYRDGAFPLAGFGVNEINQDDLIVATSFYILIDPITTDDVLSSGFRHCAIHVPVNDVFKLQEFVPENLWDRTDRLCLRPNQYDWNTPPVAIAIAMRFCGTLAGREIRLVVLSDGHKVSPVCKVFKEDQYKHQWAMIFERSSRNQPISWADIEIQIPDIFSLSNCVDITVGTQAFKVSVSLEKEIFGSVSKEVGLWSVTFNIERWSD